MTNADCISVAVRCHVENGDHVDLRRDGTASAPPHPDHIQIHAGSANVLAHLLHNQEINRFERGGNLGVRRRARSSKVGSSISMRSAGITSIRAGSW